MIRLTSLQRLVNPDTRDEENQTDLEHNQTPSSAPRLPTLRLHEQHPVVGWRRDMSAGRRQTNGMKHAPRSHEKIIPLALQSQHPYSRTDLVVGEPEGDTAWRATAQAGHSASPCQRGGAPPAHERSIRNTRNTPCRYRRQFLEQVRRQHRECEASGSTHGSSRSKPSRRGRSNPWRARATRTTKCGGSEGAGCPPRRLDRARWLSKRGHRRCQRAANRARDWARALLHCRKSQ
jgi:hypothetical protein